MNTKRSSAVLVLICLFSMLFASKASSEEKTFIKEYTYDASDLDSKVSSRTIALEQVKRLVLEELGTYLRSETEVKNFQLTSDQLTAFSAGLIKITILDELWNGKTYTVKAMVIADPEEVTRSIARLLSDQTQSKMLEEASRKADQSLKEIENLKSELERLKAGDQRREKYDKAVDILSSRQWFDKGYALIIAGNYQEAIPAYLKVVELEPENVAGRIHLAWAYNAASRFHEALAESNGALALDPENPYAFIQLGWSYIGLGEYQRAVLDLDKAVSLNPNDPYAFYYRAWARNALGDFILAKSDMDNALSINPGQQSFYSMRGWSCNGLGNYQEALEDLDMALKLDPKDKYSYIQRGWAYNGEGNYIQAEKDFYASLDIDPKFADGYYNLAIFYYYKEGKDKALIFLARAVALNDTLKQRAKTDIHFKNLGNDEQFRKLVN